MRLKLARARRGAKRSWEEERFIHFSSCESGVFPPFFLQACLHFPFYIGSLMDSADSARCSYPCGACSRDIEDGERSILCEGSCAAWFHCDCALGVRLTAGQFSKLANSEEPWVCPNCCGDTALPAFNSAQAIDVFHFDFQKNIPTPKLTVGKQFYHRLLWTHLFGIWSASKGILCAFMWNELVAHRGANDVVSCLSHFIFNTALGRTGAKWSIWWADNCIGQNKNHCVVWFFQDLIRRNVFSRIDYKFLVVGHTYGPTDRCFGAIEKYLYKLENVYTPQEWYHHVQKSSSIAEVMEMKQENFHDHRSYLRNIYTERNKDEERAPLQFSKAVWFNFGIGEELVGGVLQKKEHKNEVWLRYTHDITEVPRSFLLQKIRCFFHCSCTSSALLEVPSPNKSSKSH